MAFDSACQSSHADSMPRSSSRASLSSLIRQVVLAELNICSFGRIKATAVAKKQCASAQFSAYKELNLLRDFRHSLLQAQPDPDSPASPLDRFGFVEMRAV